MHTRIRIRELDLARSQIKVDHNSRSECALRTGNGLLSKDGERKDQYKSHPQHILRNRCSGLEVLYVGLHAYPDNTAVRTEYFNGGSRPSNQLVTTYLDESL